MTKVDYDVERIVTEVCDYMSQEIWATARRECRDSLEAEMMAEDLNEQVDLVLIIRLLELKKERMQDE